MLLKIKEKLRHIMQDCFLPFMINRDWKREFGYKIDWNNPQTINEKMQWLVCFGDTSLWSLCADKFRVREFLEQRGLGDLAIDLYGVWRKAEDIEYEKLPSKFILKCNHDSGTYFIIDRSKGFDQDFINKELNKALKRKYGYVHNEIYYNDISPCIIAEEFLVSSDCSFSSSLVDYKVWCFDGKPYCTWVCHNRTKDFVYVNVYDMEWNVHPEHSVFTDHYRDGQGLVPKPKTFDQMMNAAAKLSEGFPEVRVDFYEVDGKLYFGELTFMSLAGKFEVYTKDFLIELGEQCKLPNLSK